MSNSPNRFVANPYAPPQAPAGGPQWDPHGSAVGRLDGNALVLPNGAALPSVCSKCATGAGLRPRNVKFSFVPAWARFFGPLIQVIVMKKSRFDVPLCEPCNAEWKKWNLFAWLAILPGLGLLGTSALLEDPGILATVSFVVMLVALVTVLVLRKRRVVVATKIDKTHTWMTGLHDEMKRLAVGG